jgi:hypothetical protein
LQGRAAAIWPGPRPGRLEIYLVGQGLSHIRKTAVGHPEEVRRWAPSMPETVVDMVSSVIKTRG